MKDDAYARLLIRAGVNLQPGQCLMVDAELGHRGFVRRLVASAYDAGARYVHVNWEDPLSTLERYRRGAPESLDFVPRFEESLRREMLEEDWARIRLSGEEYPDAMSEVDPALLRRALEARARRFLFFREAQMRNQLPWCVASVPTRPWAGKVFPDLDGETALARLEELVERVCRLDRDDPLRAWEEHDAALRRVASFLEGRGVRALRYLDERPGPDGRPSTDLTVGLTDRPVWVGISSLDARGRRFIANIPTEEVFSTPHNGRASGWARTSKPAFPFEREVSGAWFRFEGGEVVEWSAEVGRDVLDELFRMDGARRLGEVSLVDSRSPVNRAGVVFHDTLYDENAASHIAFGRAYPEGLQGGEAMGREELQAAGCNESDAHEDFMIGTSTMTVTGLLENGGEVVIMRNGMFAAEPAGRG